MNKYNYGMQSSTYIFFKDNLEHQYQYNWTTNTELHCNSTLLKQILSSADNRC
jgi:hypothetical protein